MIGAIIFGLISIPLVATMIIGTSLPPRSFKVSLMFTSVFLLLVIAMVVCFFLFTWGFGQIIP